MFVESAGRLQSGIDRYVCGECRPQSHTNFSSKWGSISSRARVPMLECRFSNVRAAATRTWGWESVRALRTVGTRLSAQPITCNHRNNTKYSLFVTIETLHIKAYHMEPQTMFYSYGGPVHQSFTLCTFKKLRWLSISNFRTFFMQYSMNRLQYQVGKFQIINWALWPSGEQVSPLSALVRIQIS